MSTGSIKDFSCGGVVWDQPQDRLLLVQVENLAGNRVWTFPKGHPEPNESDTDAALREVREETGWRCQVVRPITDVDYFYTRNGQRYHKLVRWFLMAPEQKVGDFAPNEILDCQWLDVPEAKRRVLYDSEKTLLRHLGL
jgi:8-oxo-dGTP pyrophosphatase MutT (NUDIX family)